MGEHIDQRSPKRKKTNEQRDVGDRKRKASFKQYLRQVEEDLLDDEMDDFDDFADEYNEPWWSDLS